MRLILAPRQLQRRADLYQQLGQLLAAGVTLIAALEMIERAAKREDRPHLRRLLEALRNGASLSESLAQTGRWVPDFDRALLHGGEQSGRLPECFHLLSAHYGEQTRLARQTLSDLAYPVFLLHFAVFLFPFPGLFLTGNLFAYLGRTLGVLAPLYGLALVTVYALQARHGLAWRAALERVLHAVPLLGLARRELALARLASSLEALLSAGVSVLEAWEMAALACGSPALAATVASWAPNLRAGQTPSEAIRNSRQFPDLFADLYQTGEVSGKLDESLRNLSRYYQEEGSRKMRLLAQWGPRVFYLLIVLLIAIKIVSFWTGYFQQIGAAIDAVP